MLDALGWSGATVPPGPLNRRASRGAGRPHTPPRAFDRFRAMVEDYGQDPRNYRPTDEDVALMRRLAGDDEGPTEPGDATGVMIMPRACCDALGLPQGSDYTLGARHLLSILHIGAEPDA